MRQYSVKVIFYVYYFILVFSQLKIYYILVISFTASPVMLCKRTYVSTQSTTYDTVSSNIPSLSGIKNSLYTVTSALGFISNILFLATSTLNSPIVSCIAIISLFRFPLINYLGRIH